MCCRISLPTGATEGLVPPRGRDRHVLMLPVKAKPHKTCWIVTPKRTTIMTTLPPQHPGDAIPTMFPRRQKCAFSYAEHSIWQTRHFGNPECRYYYGEVDA